MPAPAEQSASPAVLPAGNRQTLKKRQIAIAILGGLVAAALIAVGLAARYFATRNTTGGLGVKQSTSLVVLPLENLSGDQE
jgi:hypothetical protein